MNLTINQMAEIINNNRALTAEELARLIYNANNDLTAQVSKFERQLKSEENTERIEKMNLTIDQIAEIIRIGFPRGHSVTKIAEIIYNKNKDSMELSEQQMINIIQKGRDRNFATRYIVEQLLNNKNILSEIARDRDLEKLHHRETTRKETERHEEIMAGFIKRESLCGS